MEGEGLIGRDHVPAARLVQEIVERENGAAPSHAQVDSTTHFNDLSGRPVQTTNYVGRQNGLCQDFHAFPFQKSRFLKDEKNLGELT